jgi:hypothetical protein
VLALLWCIEAWAGPAIAPGDLALRHDIQRLADAGLITGPVTTWPLAWGPIAADISALDRQQELPADVLQSLARVRSRANWEMRTGHLRFNARLAIAEKPTRIRSFADTPRESGEIGGGLDWTGDRLSIQLNGQVVDSPADGEDYRADGVEVADAARAQKQFFEYAGPLFGVRVSPQSSVVPVGNTRPYRAVARDRSRHVVEHNISFRWNIVEGNGNLHNTASESKKLVLTVALEGSETTHQHQFFFCASD